MHSRALEGLPCSTNESGHYAISAYQPGQEWEGPEASGVILRLLRRGQGSAFNTALPAVLPAPAFVPSVLLVGRPSDLIAELVILRNRCDA